MIEFDILIIGIGLIAILVIIGLAMFTKELDSLHKDVRRTIELGFWEQKFRRKTLKILRKK